ASALCSRWSRPWRASWRCRRRHRSRRRPGCPPLPCFTLLTMSSFVAGVTEEASFRGYMQGAIEQRYGLSAGILVSGTMFGVLHFPNHPNAVLQMLPYYIAVSALYGGLTWATNSILPALALHVGGDV